MCLNILRNYGAAPSSLGAHAREATVRRHSQIFAFVRVRDHRGFPNRLEEPLDDTGGHDDWDGKGDGHVWRVSAVRRLAQPMPQLGWKATGFNKNRLSR